MLAMAGEGEYPADDGAYRGGEDLRGCSEIKPELRPQKRQDDEQADQDDEAVGLQPGEGARKPLGEYPDQDATAIERRNGEEIEDRQDDIDDQCVPQIVRQPLAGD